MIVTNFLSISPDISLVNSYSSLKIVLENVKKDGKDLEKNLTYKIINY